MLGTSLARSTMFINKRGGQLEAQPADTLDCYLGDM